MWYAPHISITQERARWGFPIRGIYVLRDVLLSGYYFFKSSEGASVFSHDNGPGTSGTHTGKYLLTYS